MFYIFKGFQKGGALIIDKDGNQLLEYMQDDASENISVDAVLKALNLNNQ